MRAALVVFAVLGPSVVDLTAQSWEQITPGVRINMGICYDPVREVTVVFGGDSHAGSSRDARETWEWDGLSWTCRAAPMMPSARSDCPMAYDPVNGGCLLFGGWNAGGFTDTWLWDGVRWTELAPANVPPGSTFNTMATDWARGVVVLAAATETWEWDGSDWRRASSTVPGAGPICWDAGRQRVAMFDGSRHWEWDGSRWTQVTSSAVPTPRSGHSMVYDEARSRLVVFGGVVNGNFNSDVWEQDGSRWILRNTAHRPGGRRGHGAVYDRARRRVAIFGGSTFPAASGGVWEWDGTTWHSEHAGPIPTVDHSVASDPATGRILIYGPGSHSSGARTFTAMLQNGVWTRFSPSSTPPGERFGALVFDSGRGVFVHIGGTAFGGPFGAVTEWVGNTWVPVGSGLSPRYRHMAAYDPMRGRILVFGGVGATQTFEETWESDGVTWRLRPTSAAPPWRDRGGMAFDPVSQRIILFGGRGIGSFGDTWAWNGNDWVQLSPLTSPAPRQDFAMALDHTAGRIVVQGGESRSSGGLVRNLSDTWEWDGANWRQIASGSVMSAGAHMASDGDRLVRIGGGNANDPSADVYVFDRLAGQVTAYGPGCSGAPLAPTLKRYGVPRTGNPSFGAILRHVPPQAVCWVGVSDGQDRLPLGSGCTVLVQPWFAVRTGVSTIAGVGQVRIPVPESPIMTGLTFYLQGFAVDPSAPLGYAFTHGLQVDVGG